MGQGRPKSASCRLFSALAVLCLSAGFLSGAGESPAAAQAVDVTDSTAFDPLGLTYAGFLAFPSLEIGTSITDNVRESKEDPKADIGLRLRPALDLRSDWLRHALTVHADSENIFYARDSDQNVHDANLESKLRLDIMRDFSTTFEARYQLSQEGLSSADLPTDALNPRKDETYGFFSGVTYEPGRVAVTLRGGSDWHRYGDVKLANGTVDTNSDLNYTAPLAELRLKYQDGPMIVPYVEASYIPRIYDKRDDTLGVKRSSDGARFAIGAEFAPDALWSGEAALTYEIRDYYNLALKTVDGVGFDANVIWRPTRITAVSFNASSDIAETDVAGASATREYSAGIRVDHALRYNFIAGVLANYAFDNYVGIHLNEQTFSTGFDLTYSLTRDVALVGGYRFADYSSTEKSRDYNENRVTIGLRLQK